MSRLLPLVLLLAVLRWSPAASSQAEAWRDPRLDAPARLLLEECRLADPAAGLTSRGPFPPADGAGRRGWFILGEPGWRPTLDPDQVRWRAGERWLLDLDGPALEKLLADPGLRAVSAEGRLEPCLDLALPLSGAHLVQAGAPELSRPYDGAGTLVGVIDSGIDPAHRDFWLDGRCRILRLWDQVAGGLFDRAALEAGAAGNRDPDGHGTHVAAIAAGGGRSAPGGAGGGPFIGHAPAAELLVVRSTLSEGDILRAAEWIFATADQLGRPCVINLSLETHLGAHDGSSTLENELEAMSGPGRLLVCAAGNAAAAGRHASAEYNSSRSLAFTTTEGDGLYLDAWLDSPDAPAVSLLLPDGSRREPGPAGLQAGWFVQLAPPALEGGRWRVLLRLEQGRAGEAFQLQLSHGGPGFRSLHAWGGGLAFAQPDPASTLGIPATGDSMLVAGALLHRLEWTDETGRRWQYSEGAVGEASPFSARGPRVDGLARPHVLMPGQGVFSAMSAALAADPAWSRWRHADGAHILRQGTSMAAPALAGLIALALEREPRLSFRQADSLLRLAAPEDWSPARGHGLPDAVRLLGFLQAGLSRLEARPGLDEVELTWKLGSTHPGGWQALLRRDEAGEAEVWREEATAGDWRVTAAAPHSPLEFVVEVRDEDGTLLDRLATGSLTLLAARHPRLLALWPNPVPGRRLQLELISPAAVEQPWTLLNLGGARVAGGRLVLGRGRQGLVLELPAKLAAGTYLLQVGEPGAGWPLTLLP
jgi:subtilisin family serine protease